MTKDPYRVLGVPETAGDAEIKSAYRKLAKRYHPDLHPNDPAAAQRMNELNEAYDAIRDAKARAAYARGAARPAAQSAAGPAGPGGRGGYAAQGADPWEEIFRRAEQDRRRARPQARLRLGRLLLIMLLGSLCMRFLTGAFSRLLGGG
ncbi:MAG: J domain-containing protein, partial [Clostridia bacterium]|nr:J domain-containing protein [Clostridia bacterium]